MKNKHQMFVLDLRECDVTRIRVKQDRHHAKLIVLFFCENYDLNFHLHRLSVSAAALTPPQIELFEFWCLTLKQKLKIDEVKKIELWKFCFSDCDLDYQ